jgi:hypothetical protein
MTHPLFSFKKISFSKVQGMEMVLHLLMKRSCLFMLFCHIEISQATTPLAISLGIVGKLLIIRGAVMWFQNI